MEPRHIYVHVPFCARRCSYCDFAIAVRRVVPVDQYLAAVAGEIDLRFGPRLPPAARGIATGPDGERAAEVDTIYLGGGTPSRLGSDGVHRLLDVVRKRWVPTAGGEVTIEANPDDVTRDSAAAWRAAGVTRVSLGVQSFNDHVLRWMHRTHDARQAVAAARVCGDFFDDWSLDLIFALPTEVSRSWQDDLDRAVELQPSHVSCYGLTVESHTPLVRWRERGQVHEAGDERYEVEFLEADRMLGSAGFLHYEVSNYALPGHTARHNSAYWRRVPYAGLGPSAHSFDGGRRRWNLREFTRWEAAVSAGRDPVEGTEVVEAEGTAIEAAYLGLRTSQGVALTTGNRSVLERWVVAGWAIVTDNVLRLTPQGWLRLDSLAAALTDVRSR